MFGFWFDDEEDVVETSEENAAIGLILNSWRDMPCSYKIWLWRLFCGERVYGYTSNSTEVGIELGGTMIV
jgi:hypothetical protein